MLIRKIRPSDASAFWQMQYELDHETKYMMYEPGERTRNMELIEGLVRKAAEGDDLLLAAEEDGEIVGFLSPSGASPTGSGTAPISWWAYGKLTGAGASAAVSSPNWTTGPGKTA